MASITFLTGYKAFKKRFTPDSTTSYPLIKTVSSQCFEYEVSAQGLRHKTQMLAEAANAGACLLKGPLKRELAKESRAGASDKNAQTQSILLDVDGLTIPGLTVTVPMDKTSLANVAEEIVKALPAEFHEVSYIVHASASMGLKGNQVRMHLDFATTSPIHPSSLKNYLTHLNLKTPLFMNNTKLSATGKALIYPIDRCLADNSRLVFIGRPEFVGVQDPIPDPSDRIFLVEKNATAVDVSTIIDAVDIAKNNKDIRKRIHDLRTAAGLSDVAEKTQRVKIRDEYVDLVVNPDQITMTFHQDHGGYITYNINDGDSHGYYVRKDTPNIVWNFKGEPPFLFSQADPDAYERHLEEFCKDETFVMQEPFVFRDIESNTYFNGFFNPATKSIDFLRPSDRGSLLSFMAENGGVMPEHPPQWKITFDPNNPVELDKRNGIVNTWQEPPLLSNLIDVPELGYGAMAQNLQHMCPFIHKTIWSVAGSDTESYEHFINWLAFILQTRGKTMTAWLFQGVEGTGKGVLSSHIIKPMLENQTQTRSYYHAMRMENIREQFNDWISTSLIAIVDEFHAAPNSAGAELFDKIKNYITEEFSPVRRMRKEHELVRNRANLIFTTNAFDPLEPSESDRRLNIAPRQEVPIERAYPGYRHAILTGTIEKELPTFASLMMRFQFDHQKAICALDNQAKKDLRALATDTPTEFVNAVRNGDLEFFSQLLQMTSIGQVEDYRLPAANYCRTWIRDALNDEASKIATAELMPAYNTMVGRIETSQKFGTLLRKRGLTSERLRRGEQRIHGFQIRWNITPENLEDLAKEYLPEFAKGVIAKPPRAEVPGE